MPELNGSLSGVGLLSVVQLIGELRHTGTLYLTQAGTSGSLAFDDGRLVAAACGRERGLQALAQCALDLTGADFRFVEGAPTIERTLDLAPADLARLLTRIDSGEFSLDGAADEPELAESVVACALLGFADDRDHHYSRSTAMHRCYASGAPTLISAQDQRELCLSGRFAVCPRFRASATAAPAAAEVPPPPPRPAPLRAVPPRPAPRPIPPGVAARMAAASQMQIAPGPAAAPRPSPAEPVPAPAPAAATAPPPRVPRPSPASASAPRVSAARAPMFRRGGARFMAAVAALGLALLLLIGWFLLPALRGGLLQRPTTAPPAAAAQAAAASPVSVAGARVTAVPTGALAAAARPAAVASPGAAAPTPSRVSAPASAPRPDATTAPADSNTLMDVRFASGPASKWLNNPPYVSWGDGAYRLLAKDATRFVAVGVPLDQVLSDVIVSATFRKTGGPPGGGYGLIVRDQGPEPRDGENQELNAYVLETGDLGEYGVWRRDGDHWVDLVPWARSPAVRSGGSPNDLLVRAVGDQLTFSVNGNVIAVVTDDTYAQGGVGLFVGGDYNDVALDRFDIQLPN